MAVPMSVAVDDATGDQQQGRSLWNSNRGCLSCRVREQAEGEARRGELSDTRRVVHETWCMSGIGVAECPEFFVITGDESGTGVDTTADIDESAIDVEAELGHGVGFVDVRRSKELGSEGSEDFLRGNEKAAVVFAASGDI